MTGKFGSGSADKVTTPKQPDKAPVPPDAQKSQHDNARAHDKTAPPDGKGGKDNHAPSGPQGGNPAEIGPKGDTGSHQSGDKTGDTHRSGDGPVKINEAPGPRSGDDHRHGGDHAPGPRLSDNMSQWRAQFESHGTPHPEAATKPATEIKHPAELPPLGFTHKLDLNQDYRKQDGTLDWAKMRAQFVHIVKTSVGFAQPERPRPGSGHPPPGGYGNRELRVQPVDIKVHLEHAKSGTEVVQVRAFFEKVCKETTKWDVRPHVEGPKWGGTDVPGPGRNPHPEKITPRQPPSGPDRVKPQQAQYEIHRPQQLPPVRQLPHIQPHFPGR